MTLLGISKTVRQKSRETELLSKYKHKLQTLNKTGGTNDNTINADST